MGIMQNNNDSISVKLLLDKLTGGGPESSLSPYAMGCTPVSLLQAKIDRLHQ